MTLFHSVNPRYPGLIDFIYKDKAENVHAFQATLKMTQDADPKKIRELRKTLGKSPLTLYYLVPAENFHGFVTDPVKPETDALTSIQHILVPNPKGEISI